jgi:hypothetical protein
LGFIWNSNGTKMDMPFLADASQINGNIRGNTSVGWMGSPTAPGLVATNQILWGQQTTNFAINYTATTNKWVWIEEHFVINTPGQADGILEFYVDGDLKGRHTDIPYRDSSMTRGWSTFQHTAEWGGGGGTVPATQYWWVDHTVISTTRIGRPGSGSGDITPPSSPMGVRIH